MPAAHAGYWVAVAGCAVIWAGTQANSAGKPAVWVTHLSRGAAMHIRLTGRLQVSGPAGAVDVTELPGRQGRIVLTVLALTPQPVPRELLADRIWGDRLPKAWERDLSAIVSKVRAALGRVGAGEIRSDAGSYHLAVPGDAVDVRWARRAGRAAERALTEGDNTAALRLAGEVVEITGRPFLAGEDGAWVEEVRAELRYLRLHALEVSADAHAKAGETADALRVLDQALDLEPYRETTSRRLMRVHLGAGNRAEAVRVYERLREMLAEDLGIDPSPDTQRVYLEALRTQVQAAAAPAAPPPDVAPVIGAVPRVRYARSGRVNLAYQVVGAGPIDLVLVPGWTSNVELCWQEPRMAGFLHRLSSISRLILFDKRGTGLSDPIPLDAPPSLEERMDDVRAIMDAAGSERATILGFSEGGVMSVLFAATYPERTAGLILWGTWCRQLRDDTFPFGWTRDEGTRRFLRPILQTGAVPPQWFAPSATTDPAFVEWFGRYARQSASPGMAIALLRANASMDVRDVLPTVRVPTLVLHRTDDVLVDVGQGRYLADHIPGATIVEFPGSDHWPWIGESEPIMTEIAAFLTRVAEPVRPRLQVLATVVAATMADALSPAVAATVAGHRGVVVERTADSLVARFDGPGRAVRCAVDLVRNDPGPARAGVHTGELALDGDRVHGVPVDVSWEVARAAAEGEVLVTRTVTDLVAGSGLRFTPRGERDLAAVAGHWALFSAN